MRRWRGRRSDLRGEHGTGSGIGDVFLVVYSGIYSGIFYSSCTPRIEKDIILPVQRQLPHTRKDTVHPLRPSLIVHPPTMTAQC